MSLIDDVRTLFARRKYAVLEAPTDLGVSLLLDQDDPYGGVAAGDENDPSSLIEVWCHGDLLYVDSAEVGTLKFSSAAELDRFVSDLLSVGWSNIDVDDYRTVQ